MEPLIVMFSIAWLIFGGLLVLACGDNMSKTVSSQQAILFAAIEISLSIILGALIVAHFIPKH